MSNTLTIPDNFFKEAALAIAGFQLTGDQITDANRFDASRVEKILRSYVYLGVNKQIEDYFNSLDIDAKNAIVNAVMNRTQNAYSWRPLKSTAESVLRTSEYLSTVGSVSPNVAAPRTYQERYEQNVKDAPELPNPVAVGVQNFFNVVKTTLESALKGLGLDIPLSWIILALVAFLVFSFSRSLRVA